MFIVFGTRLYGKVDEVPGLFHVATNFFHVWYLPLIPVGSVVVLDKRGGAFRGAKIDLSVKSVLVAWARLWLFVAAIFAGVFGFGLLAGRTPMWGPGIAMLVIAAACVACGGAAWAMSSIRRANYHRAVQLAEKIGLSEEGLVLIELAFKRVSEADAKSTIERLQADAREIERLRAEQAAERAASTPPTAPPTSRGSTLDQELRALLARGAKIEAIKLHRERTGSELAEAKQYVESLTR